LYHAVLAALCNGYFVSLPAWTAGAWR